MHRTLGGSSSKHSYALETHNGEPAKGSCFVTEDSHLKGGFTLEPKVHLTST